MKNYTIILLFLLSMSLSSGAQSPYDSRLYSKNNRSEMGQIQTISQADLTNATMNTIAGRDELIAEWRKLDKLQPPQIYLPIKEGGRIFYQKRMPGEKVSKVYFRENMEAPEQLLFDPLSFLAGRTLSVQQIVPSYDGKKLLIGYSENGAEVRTIQVMDVDTKQFLPDVINAASGIGGWTFDNKAFMYSWIKSADNTDPTARLNPKTKLHTLGTDPKMDIDFFSNETYPALNIPAKVYPLAFLAKDSRDYVFAGESSVQNELKRYYAPIAQFNSGKIEWKTLCTPNYDNGHFTEDREVTFANFADQFAFVMWQCGHPDFQLKKDMITKKN